MTQVRSVSAGCDASRVGVVHFLAYTHAAGGLSALLEATPGSAQEFKVKVSTWSRDSDWFN